MFTIARFFRCKNLGNRSLGCTLSSPIYLSHGNDRLALFLMLLEVFGIRVPAGVLRHTNFKEETISFSSRVYRRGWTTIRGRKSTSKNVENVRREVAGCWS